jgi:ankyrin repeat protein
MVGKCFTLNIRVNQCPSVVEYFFLGILQKHDNSKTRLWQRDLMMNGIVMKKIKQGLLVLAMLVSVNAARAGTNDVGSLLQKGLFEEEANHNLEAAIQAYQAVVSQADKERRFEATAIFRLGECYRKQGKTNEANGQYSRIVREFSDQTELVKLSESYMGSGSKTAPPFAGFPQGLGTVSSASPSDIIKGFGDRPSTEEREVKRIQAMIRDSPDLINGENGDGSPLINAIRENQLAVARFLLDNKADVNAGKNSETAINWAAELGNKPMIELLLDHGADVNDVHSRSSDKFAPLHQAAERGYRSLAELLLTRKADVNNRTKSGLTPLHIASEKGFKAFAELLMANGADVAARDNSGATPLYSAIGSGNEPTVELLLASRSDVNAKTQSGMTPLMKAAQSGQFEIARLLLEKGAEVNAKCDSGVNTGWSPLHFAVQGNRNDLVKLFLDAGADTNPKVSYSIAPPPSGSSGQYQGIAPLSMAVVRGQKETVELLLGHKADVNAREDSDTTPLLWAVFQNQPEIAELLLANGADVNAQNIEHQSALSGAVGRRLPEMVKVLLSHKPIVEVFDNQGMTPLQIAVGYDHTNIVELLLAAGANVDGRYNHPGYNHMTLLELAVSRQNKPMVELLLAHKANPNLQDDFGKTPLSFAKVSLNPGQPKSFQQIEQEKTMAAIGSLLREAGANDNLERLSVIQLGRDTAFKVIFWKGTNSFNSHTLFEVIAKAYSPEAWAQAWASRDNEPPGYRFPDFHSITINRLSEDGHTNVLKVDISAPFVAGDCSQDIPLQWGDMVEVPEQDHNVNQRWLGLDDMVADTLKKCLRREVEIVVKGKTTKLTLVPAVLSQTIHGNQLTNQLDSFWLKRVVQHADVVLASSDTTRVRVKRMDPKTKQIKELLFNLGQSYQYASPSSSGFESHTIRLSGYVQQIALDPSEPSVAQTDLWLRDGDVIEIPEKP